jgi:hypothetical protein
MSADAAAEPAAASRITEQYEALRTAALGGGLPVDARSGLALFLRRGMWGWAQAAALPSTPPPRTRSRSSTSIAEERQQAVIHLFAAMAMRSTKRRAHERIAQSPVASSRA